MVSISLCMLPVPESVVWSVAVCTHTASWLLGKTLVTYSLPITPIILPYLSIKYTVLVHPKGINIALYTLRGLILHTQQCDIKNNCPKKLCKGIYM